MIQKIKKSLLVLASVFSIAVPVLAPVSVLAAGNPSLVDNNLCNGSNFNINASGAGSNCPAGENGNNINNLLVKIVNIISAVVGVVAVIMIIFGGFKYITSGGDSNNVSGAKNTIIYAIIGLVIVALAQVIVHFVINASTGLSG